MTGRPDWRIHTPQGAFVTAAAASPKEDRAEPDKAYCLSHGGSLFVWDHGGYRLELLRTPVKPTLTQGNAIDGCEAAVWRFQSRTGGLTLSFECGWEALPANADGGPASGEGLDAQTWRIGRRELSLGTEDGEALGFRAAQGNGLPERLAPLLAFDSVAYSANGLRVILPPLLAGEQGEMRFLVAWNEPKDEEDVSTWLAVDLPSIGFILEHAGCT